jgi:SAM-dependent methyltransferase
MTPEPHSAAYFGPERDFWWNLDQLELIARRRGLGSARSVLDVGSGVGHWGRLMARLVAPTATITGIEREARWVEEATRRAEPYGARFHYQQGVAEALPFDDGTFDLVTCQTVLIHTVDPRAVIREMLRVVKPDGQLVVAEPNNRASYIVDTSVTAGTDLVDVVSFYLTCERGKIALGEGNSSLGDLVPGYFAEAGLVDVEAFLSDKTTMMIPPYAGEEQQALKAQMLDEAHGYWGWSREEAQRYHQAGGGSGFDAAWERRMAEVRAAAAAVEAGTFHSAGATILYLIAGRRPPQ